jgi:hypothetical protein
MRIDLFSQISGGATRKKTFGTTSASMELPAAGQREQRLQLFNAGSVPVFFRLAKNGTDVATVPTDTVNGGDCVPAGAIYSITRAQDDTHIAAITESSTASLVVTAYYGY